jgi:hypothetical protein
VIENPLQTIVQVRNCDSLLILLSWTANSYSILKRTRLRVEFSSDGFCMDESDTALWQNIFIYRVSHIRCSTTRHERGCAACPRYEQGKATLRRSAGVKTR